MIKIGERYILGIDHGYGYIKTANTLIKTGLRSYDSNPVFLDDVLEYKGRWYKVSETRKEFAYDKTLDDDYYHLTLAAIAKELDREDICEADVCVACGLPLSWIKVQRERFREYMLKNETADFRFDGKDFKIRFAGCIVFPQTYPAVIGWINIHDGINIVIDIGSETLKIMYVKNGQTSSEWCWTERYGINRCMNRIKHTIMRDFGTVIEDDAIEEHLCSGIEAAGDKYCEVVREVSEQYTVELLGLLRKYEYSPDLVRLHILGGGAKFVKNHICANVSNVNVLEDIHLNARGFEQLATRVDASTNEPI